MGATERNNGCCATCAGPGWAQLHYSMQMWEPRETSLVELEQMPQLIAVMCAGECTHEHQKPVMRSRRLRGSGFGYRLRCVAAVSCVCTACDPFVLWGCEPRFNWKCHRLHTIACSLHPTISCAELAQRWRLHVFGATWSLRKFNAQNLSSPCRALPPSSVHPLRANSPDPNWPW